MVDADCVVLLKPPPHPLCAVLVDDVLDASPYLRDAMRAPFGGAPGCMQNDSQLLAHFDLDIALGAYPTGLTPLDIPAADKVGSGRCRVLCSMDDGRWTMLH